MIAGVSVVALAEMRDTGHHAAPPPTPTILAQVRRAAEVGPGFLDYCPTKNGRLPARYDITLPGATGRANGWCETTVRRGRNGDTVTFRAHWDGRKIIGRQGTLVLVYWVPVRARPKATPVVALIGERGRPPP
jgi:hypothetical protein